MSGKPWMSRGTIGRRSSIIFQLERTLGRLHFCFALVEHSNFVSTSKLFSGRNAATAPISDPSP